MVIVSAIEWNLLIIQWDLIINSHLIGLNGGKLAFFDLNNKHGDFRGLSRV